MDEVAIKIDGVQQSVAVPAIPVQTVKQQRHVNFYIGDVDRRVSNDHGYPGSYRKFDPDSESGFQRINSENFLFIHPPPIIDTGGDDFRDVSLNNGDDVWASTTSEDEDSGFGLSAAEYCPRDFSTTNLVKCVDEEETGAGDEVDAGRRRKEEKYTCWVTIISFCIVEVLIGGIAGSFSILYAAPFEAGHISASVRSWMFHAGKSCTAFAGFLAGPTSIVFGHRLASFGLFMGTLGLVSSSSTTEFYGHFLAYVILICAGLGFGHYVLYLHMQKNADNRRGLATGMSRAAKAAGSALIPQVVRYLTANHGFPNMMLVLALLTSTSIVFGVIQTSWREQMGHHMKADSAGGKLPLGRSAVGFEMAKNGASNGRPTPSAQQQLPSRANTINEVPYCISLKKRFKRSLDFTVLKEPLFFTIVAMDLLQAISMGNVFFALPFYAMERGFGSAVAAHFLTTLEVADVIGAFVIPPLFDVKGLNFLYIYGLLQFSASFALVGMAVPDRSLRGMFIISAFLGIVRAGTSGMTNVFLIKYLTIERFPSTMSMKVLSKAVALQLGTLNGPLVDHTGTYASCLYVSSGADILCGTLTSVVLMLARQNKKATLDERTGGIMDSNVALRSSVPRNDQQQETPSS